MSFQLVVNYFELVCQLESKSEIVKEMIAEYFDENLLINNTEELWGILVNNGMQITSE